MRTPALAAAAAALFIPHFALAQAGGLVGTVGQTVTGVTGTVGTTIGGLGGTAGGAIGGLGGTAGGAIGGVGGTAGGLVGGVTGAVGGVVGGATGAIGGAVGGIGGAVGGATGGIGGAVGGATGGVGGGVGGAVGGAAGGGAIGGGSSGSAGAGPITTASLPSGAGGGPSGSATGLSVPSISLPAALAPCDDSPRTRQAGRRSSCGPRYTALFTGVGSVSGTREDLARFGSPLRPRTGTPQHIVQNCRDAIVAAALPYGVARVDAVSAGPMRAGGSGLTAPVEFRIVYNRQGGLETRQATISCRMNMAGRVLSAA